MKLFNKLMKKSQKGQVLVIVAITLTALVAIIGLAIDMGYMYVSYARLRRAVDAAALAGSAEFKRNYVKLGVNRLEAAAEQVLYLNLDGANTADATVYPINKVETCDTVAKDNNLLPVKDHLTELVALEHANHPGKEVCTDPIKKIVRVTVRENVKTFFLAIIPGGGIRSFPIEVVSLSEAAAVDVMLTIDTSESMTWGWNKEKTGDDLDPKMCNADDPGGAADGIPGSCFPFQDVKKAAYTFLDNLYFPYDRVGVVTFDQRAIMRLPLSDDYTTIKNTVLNLQVFEGARDNFGVGAKCPYYSNERPGYPWDNPALDDAAGYGFINPCRLYDNPTTKVYLGMDCPMFYGPRGDEDLKLCPTTDTSDGVAIAGAILTGDYSSADPIYYPPPATWPAKRDEALWVLLLLTDGAANSGHDAQNKQLCPDSENNYDWYDIHKPCRDVDALARHCWLASDTNCMDALYPPGGISYVDQTHYDPDDRARDMFDLVSSNNTLIFTIGMGFETKGGLAGTQDESKYSSNGIAPGITLLQYGAFGTYTDKHDRNALIGSYAFGNNPSDLTRIFLEIANNLATRINQ
jgi:hypothetical protein